MSTPQIPQKNNSGCLSILRDPVWQFVFGFLACLISVIGIVVALPQAAPVRTALPQVFLGGTPAPTPTLAGDETLHPNIVLQCGSCNDPVVFTIQTIVVSRKNRNVIFTLSMANNNQINESCGFSTFTLQSTLDTTALSASGGFADSACGGTSIMYPTTGMILAGTQIQSTTTFTFLPYAGVPYTLTSVYDEAHIVQQVELPHTSIPFNPVSLVF